MIIAEFQKLQPDALFDYFTVPDLLQKWCPPLAEV